MAYSHMLMVMLGKEVGDVVWGEGKHYVLFTKFFKKLYMLKIFYIVVLGNSDIFAKSFKIFQEERNGGGRGIGGVGVTFLTNLSEISSFLRAIAKYVS